MAKFYKLDNTVKHYAWGSKNWIPALIGQANSEGKPWAELWMGTHPGGPSKIIDQGITKSLSDLGELPFLLKFLAAGTPLSIQAHPNLLQAGKGFRRENAAGIDPAAPERNYKDPNHKPEIVCALTQFCAMAGFREFEETDHLLSFLPGGVNEKLRRALEKGYKTFLSTLFDFSPLELSAINAWALLDEEKKQDSKQDYEETAFRLCGKFAKIFPDDPGIISPLYLNVLELAPFESFFVPAGMLHAYVHGLAIECMANSDNVLRGGLSSKYIDKNELLDILTFDPSKPELLELKEINPGCQIYPADCRNFSLYSLKNSKTLNRSAVELKAAEKGIIVVFEGSVEVSIKSENSGGLGQGLGQSPGDSPGESPGQGEKKIFLKQGESAFITPRKDGEALSFAGTFTLFAALAPEI